MGDRAREYDKDIINPWNNVTDSSRSTNYNSQKMVITNKNFTASYICSQLTRGLQLTKFSNYMDSHVSNLVLFVH